MTSYMYITQTHYGVLYFFQHPVTLISLNAPMEFVSLAMIAVMVSMIAQIAVMK